MANYSTLSEAGDELVITNVPDEYVGTNTLTILVSLLNYPNAATYEYQVEVIVIQGKTECNVTELAPLLDKFIEFERTESIVKFSFPVYD